MKRRQKDEEELLYLIRKISEEEKVTYGESFKISGDEEEGLYLEEYEVKKIKKYNPKKDDLICVCGHTYKFHFNKRGREEECSHCECLNFVQPEDDLEYVVKITDVDSFSTAPHISFVVWIRKEGETLTTVRLISYLKNQKLDIFEENSKFRRMIQTGKRKKFFFTPNNHYERATNQEIEKQLEEFFKTVK